MIMFLADENITSPCIFPFATLSPIPVGDPSFLSREEIAWLLYAYPPGSFAVVVVVALPANAVYANGRLQEKQASQELITKIYPVADFVIPADARPEANVATIEDRLIAIITETIDRESWDNHGGATIQYFPFGQALVVRQTPVNQEKIANMLADLERLKDVHVVIEARMLSTTGCPFPVFHCTILVRLVELDESQLAMVFKDAKSDRSTNIMQCRSSQHLTVKLGSSTSATK